MDTVRKLRAHLALSGARQSLSGDDGSMLAMGVPIALVCVSVLWYMIETANAVVLTESVRTAGDQAAYEAAVWHARGMNVIACLNLLMAALISAYTAFVTVTVWANLAASFCWYDKTLCNQADADALRDKLNNADPAVQAWLDQSLKDISELERLTSTVAPRIAQNYAATGAKGSWVSAKVTYGASLVSDSQMSALLPALSGAKRMNKGPNESSLPIEETSGVNICHQLNDWTQQMVPDLIAGLNAPWFDPFIKSEPTLYNVVAEVQTQIAKIACVRQYVVAQIWEGAKQRPDIALQHYGFGFGWPDVVSNGESNLVNLTGGTASGTLLKSVSVSQAIYAPDCAGGTAWSACAALPLFDPNWSARLVRVHATPEIKNAASAVPITSVAGGAVPSAAADILNDQTALWQRVDDFIH